MSMTAIEFLIRMREHFAKGLRHDDPEVRAEVRRVLDFLPPLENTPEPDIPAPDEEPKLLPAVRAFLKENPDILGGGWQDLAERLPWRYSYEQRADDPDLDARMGWYEFIGPAAPIHSDRLGFGITFARPGVNYRPHYHPAAEVYNTVIGALTQRVGNRELTLTPGAFSYHRPNVIHSTRIGDAPVIQVYSWTGDVVTLSKYVDAP
jgi:mannose-6-phosphate isomerase-like protein (cupin superfamily)